MKSFSRNTRWLALVILLLSLAYFQGVRSVPFHPDESTQIFMSSDLRLFFTQPGALFWQAGNEADLRQRYRELDAPLTRSLIGLGRALTGQPALPIDWDWSKSWDANRQAGALPDDGLLWVARLSVAWLFPFSLLLSYRIGRQVGGQPLTGWLNLLFTAANALVLLHTRRAMAESALLFTTLLALDVILRARRPWLAALPVALAFSAKQSALALLLPALTGVVMPRPSTAGALRRLFAFGALFLAVTIALNPFLWRQPLQAVQAAAQARQSLLQQQVSGLQSVRPDLTLPSPLERASALFIHLYLTPPAIADIGNYRQQTAAAEAAYLANPLHHLLRSLPGGGLMFLLGLLGLLLSLRFIVRGPAGRRTQILFLLAGLAQWAALSAAVALPFQRYCLPLLPYATCYAAYALTQIKMRLPIPAGQPHIAEKTGKN